MGHLAVWLKPYYTTKKPWFHYLEIKKELSSQVELVSFAKCLVFSLGLYPAGLHVPPLPADLNCLLHYTNVLEIGSQVASF